MQSAIITIPPEYEAVFPRAIRVSISEVNNVIAVAPIKPATEYRGLLSGLSSTDVEADPERF